MSARLFTAEELRRLDRLRLRPPQARAALLAGEWRSRRTGASGLFADHRDYVPGDDLRYVDWNVYARLGDLVVKRFESEELIEVLLCVDRSASMAGAKAQMARRLAGALGHLTLAHMDVVRLAWLPPPNDAALTGYRGRSGSRALLEELAEVPLGGRTQHARDLARALSLTRRRGLALVVSDFYDATNAVAALAALRARGMDVVALHLVDRADVDLPRGSAIRAVDRESGDVLKLDVTPAFLDALRRAWHRRAESLERWCVSRSVLYERIDVGASLWTALRRLMGRGLTGIA